MTQAFAKTTPRLDPRKFQDPLVTARGESGPITNLSQQMSWPLQV
jgi:hypothetical protein